MYFPYLRGRQYELLALRELVENKLIGKNIIPIIEPIKLSSTLIKTVELYLENKMNLAIIHNPKVGSFYDDLEDEEKDDIKNNYMNILKDDLVYKSHILNKDSKFEIDELFREGINTQELSIIGKERDDFNFYTSDIEDKKPQFILMPDVRSLKKTFKDNRVILEDKFNKQDRNADYIDKDDEFFSDDHLDYNEEGYIGFSDYSVIGEDFSESGFAPYAVAIHIVYFDKEKNLRIKHFVSDSNEDISNPAKKFYEALTKLAKWQDKKQLKTYGMRKFMEMYNNRSYPGLGIAKKLAIMHHIELVSNYLDTV